MKREYVIINLYRFKLSIHIKNPKITTVETAVIIGLSIIKVLKLIRKIAYIAEDTITFVTVDSLELLNTANAKKPFIKYLNTLINKSHSKSPYLL